MAAAVGIFGTSGHARELADIVAACGGRPVFIARDAAEAAGCGLTGEAIVIEGELAGAGLGDYAIGVGDNHIRQRIAERYAGQLNFCNLVHPSASFGRGQRERLARARGVAVCAGVRFTNQIEIGDFTLFNQNATIAHDVIVEDYVCLAPGAHVSGNVHLELGAWIGTGASVIQGTPERRLRIGRHCTVGAGAAVVRDCEAGGVYVGVPARRMR